MAYPTLLWFAGYSNLSSVMIVIICFIIMAIFITLVSLNVDFSRPNQSLPGVEQRNMVKVVNPFFLQLEKQGKSLKDGLKLHLSRLCPCKAVVLWGVKIGPFHDVILKAGHEIRKELLCDDLSETLDLDPLYKENFQFSGSGDDGISIPCPTAVNSVALGKIPRQRYPVAVFVFVPESPERVCPAEEGDAECSNNIVGLISVIHLKDEIVTQSSHIIQQYIKTAGVPIYSLQPLFVNSASEDQCPERGASSCSDGRGSDQGANVTPHCDGAKHKHMGSSKDMLSNDTGCVGDKQASGASFSDASMKEKSESSALGSSKLPSTEAEHRQGSSEAESSDTGVRRRRHPLSSHEDLDGQTRVERGSQGSGVKSDGSFHECCDSEKQPCTDRSNLAECVVCQTRKVMCVLLPCRHACVCYGCFKLLDRCPMCRGTLQSYFLLSSDDGDESGSSGEEENDALHDIQQHAVNASFVQMWERFNMRLNALLGFR